MDWGKWQRLSSIPTSKGRMASLSVGHGSLSFETWSNGNKLSARTRRPPVGPEKGRILSYIISYPAPLSVTCLKAPYSYRSFSHIPSLWLSRFTSAFLPQTLHKPSTSQLWHFIPEDGDYRFLRKVSRGHTKAHGAKMKISSPHI
jgi:hypothetical protein